MLLSSSSSDDSSLLIMWAAARALTVMPTLVRVAAGSTARQASVAILRTRIR